jgi:hypothetical protein
MLKASDIYKAYRNKDYFVDIHRPWFVNIFIIRGYDTNGFNYNSPNIFNDTLGIIFKDNYNNINTLFFMATADPGKYYMDNPINYVGTAFISTGQYVDAYKLDYHKGQRLALCQRLAPVTVLRRKVYGQAGIPQTGYFGINIHDGSDEVREVNDNSAGCIVAYDREQFNIFLSICKEHIDKYSNKFTVTVFDRNSF